MSIIAASDMSGESKGNVSELLVEEAQPAGESKERDKMLESEENNYLVKVFNGQELLKCLAVIFNVDDVRKISFPDPSSDHNDIKLFMRRFCDGWKVARAATSSWKCGKEASTMCSHFSSEFVSFPRKYQDEISSSNLVYLMDLKNNPLKNDTEYSRYGEDFGILQGYKLPSKKSIKILDWKCPFCSKSTNKICNHQSKKACKRAKCPQAACLCMSSESEIHKSLDILAMDIRNPLGHSMWYLTSEQYRNAVHDAFHEAICSHTDENKCKFEHMFANYSRREFDHAYWLGNDIPDVIGAVGIIELRKILIQFTRLKVPLRKACDVCLSEERLYKCARCESTRYCGSLCQEADKKYHALVCRELQDIDKKRMETKMSEMTKEGFSSFVTAMIHDGDDKYDSQGWELFKKCLDRSSSSFATLCKTPLAEYLTSAPVILYVILEMAYTQQNRELRYWALRLRLMHKRRHFRDNGLDTVCQIAGKYGYSMPKEVVDKKCNDPE